VILARLDIPAEKITVSGIPVDPVFAEPKNRRATRLLHGLDPDRTTRLISAGGFGVGPIEGGSPMTIAGGSLPPAALGRRGNAAS